MLIRVKVEDAFERVRLQIHSVHRILGTSTTSKFQIDVRRSYRGYWKTNLAIPDRTETVSIQTNVVPSERVNITGQTAGFCKLFRNAQSVRRLLVSITKSNGTDWITKDAHRRITCGLALSLCIVLLFCALGVQSVYAPTYFDRQFFRG